MSGASIESIRIGYVPLAMVRPMRTAMHETTHTHNALVEIHAEGLLGQGASLALSAGQARAVCAAIEDLAVLLQGGDAGDVRGHWERMWRHLNLTGQSGIGVLALSALDTALWDLLAQSAGLPLYRLLGGSRVELPVYAQPGWLSSPIEEVIDEALAFRDQGYAHYKMRVGSKDWRADVQRVERVRDATGTDVALLVDANQGWSAVEAMAACRALDDLGLYWIEEPVDVSDVDGCSRVAASIATPVAAGETVFGTAGMRPLIERHAASILMPDLQHCGGPTGWLKVATLAEIHDLPVSNHLFTQVSVHLMAACANPLIVELMPGWWDELFDRPLGIKNGSIRPPEEPGIGFRFSAAASSRLAPIPKR